jgi:uncharacterized lipoprotein
MPIFLNEQVDFRQQMDNSLPRLRGIPRCMLVLAISLSLGACSWFGGEKKVEDDALLLPALTIPEGLSVPRGEPRLARPVLRHTGQHDENDRASSGERCDCEKPPTVAGVVFTAIDTPEVVNEEPVMPALAALPAEIKTDKDGNTVLQLGTHFSVAWERTQQALEALGFTIEDRDRAGGIFYVSNELPTGLTETELAVAKQQDASLKEEYWLHVRKDGSFVNISVRNKTERVDESQVARHVLNLLLGHFQ